MKTLSQDQPISSNRYLYSPSEKDILPLIAEGIRSGDRLLQFFGSHESEVFHALDYVIMTYDGSGQITTGTIFKAIHKVAITFEMARYSLAQLGSSNKTTCITTEEEHLFATGILDEDYEDSDSDCYMTPGGYRTWKALKGTTVKYYLNMDLSVSAVFQSDCVVDHYNNNVCGLPTGGGTTNYKPGERVENRSVRLGREWNYWEWTRPKFKATVLEIDAAKASQLATKFVPEFSFLFK